MDLRGRCHCGNIAFGLTIEPDPVSIPARACSCSFCVKHGGVWTSSPSGVLRVAVKDPSRTTRYSFGTRTADFHVCITCGVVPVVTSRIDGRDYAVVSVNALEDVPVSMLDRAASSFDGEGTEERLARRARNWIGDVRFDDMHC